MSWNREILVVDDDPMMLRAIELTLEERVRVHGFAGTEAAERLLEKQRVDVAILDLNLPGEDGIEVLRRWKTRFSDLHVIICSGESRVQRAIECMREGASDYIVKPFRREEITLVVDRVWERVRLQKAAEMCRSMKHDHASDFVGVSSATKQLLEKVDLLRGQDHLNVLILGESGTGKELIARRIHLQEDEAERPFIVANMPAIPVSLAEAELFGVEKGAFTDAKATRLGKFELADRGDIFLDEIADLSFELQSKILRTLQEGEVERLGSNRLRKVRFRAISATNRHLPSLISSDRFRMDLFYRLSDVVLELPPLRQRREDIVPLARHFLTKYAPTFVPEVSDRAWKHLEAYHWPGNVRQLESTVKRAIAFSRGKPIESFDVFDPEKWNVADSVSGSFREELAQIEYDRISAALARNGGDGAATCRELGMSRSTFYRRLKQNPAEKLPATGVAESTAFDAR